MMYKAFFALVISCLVSAEAFAARATCESVFTKYEGKAIPEHMIVARDFYASPMTVAEQKAGGRIVVTATLLQTLLSPRASVQNTKTDAVVLLALNNIPKKKFVQMMEQAFGISAKFDSPPVSRQYEVQINGSAKSIFRFLQDGFSRENVLWAGKKSGGKYVSAIRFGEDVSFEEASLQTSSRRFSRSYLEPHPSEGISGRDGPSFLEPIPKHDVGDSLF